MNLMLWRCLVVAVVLHPIICTAYERPTHERMSQEAAKASALYKPDVNVLMSLGLAFSIDDERQRFPNTEGKQRNILNIISDGSNFEDGFLKISHRPLFHFFDPVHDDGLLFFTSPTWALEDKGKIHFLQNFSLSDAREYLYRALTLPAGDERDKNFGKTFQTLGHVIHHTQDMAQPQHVRLDTHLRLDFTNEELPFEDRSRYEDYTKGLGGNLPFSGYPSVMFDTARKFWTGQGRGLADFTNRNFLSAGTNFEPGPNNQPVTNSRYRSPEWNNQIEIRTWAELLVEAGVACDANPPPGGGGGDCGNECPAVAAAAVHAVPAGPPACALTGEMEFYGTNITDASGTAVDVNPRASTLSIFDQDLVATGQRQFALNRFNFEAAYPHLIPKAVSYSAGLIDFFFRGRIEVLDVSDDDTQLYIEIRNVSATGNAFSRGRFEVYYDAADGTRKPLTISQNATADLAVNGRVVLTANRPKLSEVDLSKENPLTLVYRGRIGEEEGISAAVMEMPLSGFVAAGKHVYFEDGVWRISLLQEPEAGNIDWKGTINGRTKVLSWMGSKGRNIPDWSRFFPTTATPYVFQNGRIFAVAPAPVLGAALTLDSQGERWLVVITNDDMVYRRPAKRTRTVIFDPSNSMEGWEPVGQFPPDDNFGTPDRPWFFNASGTQAQTMRMAKKTVRQVVNGVMSERKVTGLDRLYIQLQDARVVSTQNRGNIEDGYRGTMQCGDSSRTSTVGGEYILAVDYQGDQEVLAKLSYSASEVVNFHVESSGGIGDPVYGNSNRTENATESLTVGSKTYKTFEESNNTITSVTIDQNAKTNAQQVIDRSNTIRYLYSLDLRHDLVSYYAGSVSEDTTISTIPFGYLMTVNSEVDDVEHVQLGGSELEAFKNRQQFTGEYRLIVPPRIDTCVYDGSGMPITSSETTTLPYSTNNGFASGEMRGAWLVDTAGRLFVSQTKGSMQYLVPRNTFYNYLTGGIPGDLVSQPLDGQSLVPVGLIR